MSDTLNKNFYFLSPVEVVKVTSNNLQEVAEWCGGKVATTESRRVPGRMDSYVWVPTPKGNGISWAFPGMFITKRMVLTAKNEIKTTFAVFRRDYFDKNYFATPEKAIAETWDRGKKKPKKVEPVKTEQPEAKNVTVNVMGSEVLSFEQAKAVLEEAAPGSTVTVNQVEPKRIEAGMDPVPPEEVPTTHEEAIANLEAGGITGEIISEEPNQPLLTKAEANIPGELESNLAGKGPVEQRETLREEAVEAEATIPDVEVVGEPHNPQVKEVHEPGAGEITTPGEAAAPSSIRSDVLSDDVLALLGLPSSEMDNYSPVTWGELNAEQLQTLENATK